MSLRHCLNSYRAHLAPGRMGPGPVDGRDGDPRHAPKARQSEAPNRHRPGRPCRCAGAEYTYRHGGHELALSLRDVTDLHAEAVAGGEAEFALVVEGPLLVLGCRFGACVRWAAAAPFNWHWLPPVERVVPPDVELTPETFARLWGRCGSPSSRRISAGSGPGPPDALSPPFSFAPLAAPREQALQSYRDAVGQRALAWLSHTSEGLPERATCRIQCAAVHPFGADQSPPAPSSHARGGSS